MKYIFHFDTCCSQYTLIKHRNTVQLHELQVFSFDKMRVYWNEVELLQRKKRLNQLCINLIDEGAFAILAFFQLLNNTDKLVAFNEVGCSNGGFGCGGVASHTGDGNRCTQTHLCGCDTAEDNPITAGLNKLSSIYHVPFPIIIIISLMWKMCQCFD